MIYITHINFRKKLLNKLSYYLWMSIWVILIAVSIRPKILDSYFANNYNLDLFYIVTVFSIIILVILSYVFFIKINILEKKINTIIRSESLKEILEKLKKD